MQATPDNGVDEANAEEKLIEAEKKRREAADKEKEDRKHKRDKDLKKKLEGSTISTL